MADTLLSIFSEKRDPMQAAIVIPKSAPLPSRVTYNQMHDIILDFTKKLAAQVPARCLEPGRAISISYPNSFEFSVSFLGATYLNMMAAPLNPAYTEDEFNFYLEDSQSTLLILPQGSLNDKNNPAVLAAKKQKVIVAEIFWNGTSMEVNARVPIEFSDEPHRIVDKLEPKPEEPALLLHTSGTTGRPKGNYLLFISL
jgi:acyl-CoA synthetase (AMP-forming)/AMP-acid ligase II